MFATFKQFIESDESNKYKMSDEEFKKFELRLQRAKVQIHKRYPFFYLVLSRLKTVPTIDMPTMAVDDNGNIYINPNFTMNELSFEETIGVLVHEAFHHVNLTFYRGKNKNHNLWNIATDYIMNRDILEMGGALPSLGLIPKKYGDKWIIPDMKNLDITDMTSEQLYIELESKQDELKKLIDKMSKKQEELDKHIEPGQEPQPMEVPSDDDVYKPNDGKNPQTGKPMTSEEKATKQKSEIAAISERIRRHETGAGTSQIPRSFDINKLLAPKVNWRLILKNFISKSKSTEYSWKRPSKRSTAAGYYGPSLKPVINEAVDLVIAVDTSGSIPEKTVHTFIKSVLDINRQFKTNIRMLFYNDNVYAELLINDKKSDNQIISELNKIKLTAGGNNEPAIKKYLADKKITKLQGFLLFTDGHIQPTPDFPKANRYLFLIVTGGSNKIVKKFGPTYTIDISNN